MAEHKKIINIGLLAHVDAGKTTITEQMLRASGAIRQAGNVDKGTSCSDSLPVEKERGISVQSTPLTFDYGKTTINLIDTPGQVDFSAEVERSLMALDGAILVLSSVEGIQAHTETLWEALENAKIPVLLFINKIDRTGADTEKVLSDIQKRFSPQLLSLQKTANEGEKNAAIVATWNETICENTMPEIIIEQNDSLLEQYLSGEAIRFEQLDKAMTSLFYKRKLFPAMFGSAISGIGIPELLDTATHVFPDASKTDKNQTSARIFRIQHDNKLGRLALIRQYNGNLEPKKTISYNNNTLEEKIHNIMSFKPGKLEMKNRLSSGEIAAVTGLKHAKTGDWIGHPQPFSRESVFSIPVLKVRVFPAQPEEIGKLAEAMEILNDENPLLQYAFKKNDNEIHISIMGYIQLQILESVLKSRFSLTATFGEPTVIYKETPSSESSGIVEYTMPKPCWAVMTFLIKPLPPGSGVRYKSTVSKDNIAGKYQNEVEQTIQKALKQGPLGWNVTDIDITLIDGEDHTVHSNPGDFKIATPMGIMDALVHSGTTFLEPVNRFRIVIPEECAGKVLNSLTEMRGEYETPVAKNNELEIQGFLPVATSLEYPLKLSGDTSGRGRLSVRFHEYRPCSAEYGMVRPFEGISPLDRAKYILHARQAI